MARRIEAAQVASSVPFDNTGTGYVADNVQDAIVEAALSDIGKLLPYQFETNGNTADKWLGYSNSASPSNEIPFVSPQDILIRGLTFSNRDDDVDIDIEIYKNGILVHTEEIRNKRWYYTIGTLSVAGVQGDRFSVFMKKYLGGTGDTTAQDPVVTVYVKYTDSITATGGAQIGVT